MHYSNVPQRATGGMTGKAAAFDEAVNELNKAGPLATFTPAKVSRISKKRLSPVGGPQPQRTRRPVGLPQGSSKRDAPYGLVRDSIPLLER
jgi:hypothetical protein